MLSCFVVTLVLVLCLLGCVHSLEQPIAIDGAFLDNFGSSGIVPRESARIFRNLNYNDIFDHEVEAGNTLTSTGTVAIDTGRFTGRSPKDKYIVKRQPSADNVS